jgi:hypothetical protein
MRITLRSGCTGSGSHKIMRRKSLCLLFACSSCTTIWDRESKCGSFSSRRRNIAVIQNNSRVDIFTCKVVLVTIMTGSSSDDWILVAVRLQPLLITLSHSSVAILHILQSLFTLYFSVLIWIQNSLLSLRAELLLLTTVLNREYGSI